MTQTTIDNVPRGEYVPEADARVALRMDWDCFERVIELRGEAHDPRVAYLDGVVELMSPSRNHEHLSRRLLDLLGVYFEAAQIAAEPYGNWLVKQQDDEAGLEPDECFVFGGPSPPVVDRPDLAIEIVWTSGGFDKLEIYRRLQVPEVWFWIDGVIHVHVLGSDAYVEVERSARLPDLDLRLLARLMEGVPLLEARQQLRAKLTSYR